MKKFLYVTLLALCAGFFVSHAKAQTTSAGTETIIVYGPSCTTTTPCTAQVYRAVGTCPTSGIGTLGYNNLASSITATTTTSTGSSFSFADSTAVVGTTYCYYGTVTYTSGGPASSPATYTAVIPVPPPPTPMVPTVSGAWVPASSS